MQKISGNSSFSAIFAARSSARIRRRVRSMSDSTRSDSLMLVPNRSAWISIAQNDSMSSTPVRSARLRSAVSFVKPERISSSSRSSSLATTSLRNRSSSLTFISAASSPRPASTHTVSKSSASGKSSKIFRWRTLTRCDSTMFGM